MGKQLDIVSIPLQGKTELEWAFGTQSAMLKRDNELLRLSDLRSELEAVAWIVSLADDIKLSKRLNERAGLLAKAFTDYSEACMWRDDNASDLLEPINMIVELVKQATNGNIEPIKQHLAQNGQDYFRKLMANRGKPAIKPKGLAPWRKWILDQVTDLEVENPDIKPKDIIANLRGRLSIWHQQLGRYIELNGLSDEELTAFNSLRDLKSHKAANYINKLKTDYKKSTNSLLVE